MELNKFLFNFSASYSGGGFKRLFAYAKWFNEHGGACFLIHANCDALIKLFARNRYFIVNQSKLQRFLNDSDYLDTIGKEIGIPDLYYSYGIPIYYKFGRVNWFHLSNVLPLCMRGVSLPLLDKVKLYFLGHRIKINYKNMDIISAESNYSLNLVKTSYLTKLVVSVNGSDDEILFQSRNIIEKKDATAVVMGTYQYKALGDSYAVFQMLRQVDAQLKLIIIGDKKKIPRKLLENEHVVATGYLNHNQVIEQLQKSTYYISTTQIENSYNAASEGIFFADESFISDIGPHRELIAGMSFEKVSIPKVKKPMLYIKKENISSQNLKTWNIVVSEMIDYVSMISSNLN